MRVAIVGAGLAGLGAARTLADAGVETVVFEKSHVLGGRCATRTSAEFRWDTGATSVAPLGSPLEPWVARARLALVPLPVWLHRDLTPEPGAKAQRHRYAHPEGMRKLAEAIAEGLDVRLNTEVESAQIDGFDHVVLALPIPQASVLLHRSGLSRPLAGARYRSCLSILLGYKEPLAETPYFALLDAGRRHRISWICRERAKRGGGAEAVVVQWSDEASRAHWMESDESLTESTLGDLERLYGRAARNPAAASVKRWKYSQPDATIPWETANRAADRVWIAGDGVGGGKLELAFSTGVQTANAILGARG
jgi:predicted NAD/FAD-dependent oxidoreductase